MDEKSSGDDNIKPNSNNSSDEEDIKIFNEIENIANDNMIVESEDDNLNESMDDLENKDNQKIIDNFIKLIMKMNAIIIKWVMRLIIKILSKKEN